MDYRQSGLSPGIPRALRPTHNWAWPAQPETAPPIGPFEAVVFDLDGLLIDSEPLWREAEIEVFGSIGVHLSDEMCASTMGLRIDEVVEHWYRLFPWAGPGRREVKRRVVERFVSLVRRKGSRCPASTPP